MSGTPPPRLASLPEIEGALWRELCRAPHDRHHEWRTPVLATVQDGLPDARVVVLRETEAEARVLRVYTDARSAKVAQLQAQAQAVLVLWSRRLSWQLRLSATVRVATDGLSVSSRWARLQFSRSAGDYLAPLPPGAALTDTEPSAQAPAVDPCATEPLSASTAAQTPTRHHFALLEARVNSIDWLELHPQGHRRARFDAGSAVWLQP